VPQKTSRQVTERVRRTDRCLTEADATRTIIEATKTLGCFDSPRSQWTGVSVVSRPLRDDARSRGLRPQVFVHFTVGNA
jgi:hypothetical protein